MILIDTVQRAHTCNGCSHQFKKGDKAAYVYLKKVRRSFCSKCLLTATVQLLKNNVGIATGSDLTEKDFKIFKDAFVEVNI